MKLRGKWKLEVYEIIWKGLIALIMRDLGTTKKKTGKHTSKKLSKGPKEA